MWFLLLGQTAAAAVGLACAAQNSNLTVSLNGVERLTPAPPLVCSLNETGRACRLSILDLEKNVPTDRTEAQMARALVAQVAACTLPHLPGPYVKFRLQGIPCQTVNCSTAVEQGFGGTLATIVNVPLTDVAAVCFGPNCQQATVRVRGNYTDGYVTNVVLTGLRSWFDTNFRATPNSLVGNLKIVGTVTHGTVEPSENESTIATMWSYLLALEELGIVLACVAVYCLIGGALTSRGHCSPGLKGTIFCWGELYKGRGCAIYKLLCCPFVLLAHAFRVYLCGCLYTYVWRCTMCVFGVCGGCMFTDKDFPPEESSLGGVGGDSADAGRKDTGSAKWIRAPDLAGSGQAVTLFEGEIECADIMQGSLGNCWWVASIAAVAEKPGLIQSVFLTKELNPWGRYQVRLFDGQKGEDGEWVVVTVDDYVPCDPRTHEPQFAKMHNNELWVVILEKALAKMCGSYKATEGGSSGWGMRCLTGQKCIGFSNQKAQGEWSKQEFVNIKDATDKRKGGFKPCVDEHYKVESYDDGDMFQTFQHYVRVGAIMCTSWDGTGQDQGLVSGHAFSLLDVQRVQRERFSTSYLRMVQIRNPWGRGEWTGEWSDNSKMWDSYPYVASQLNHDPDSHGEDGAYWMCWEDFISHCGRVDLVDVATDLTRLATPPYVESSVLGPFCGCVSGCLQFWLYPCYGIRYMLCPREPDDDLEAQGKCGFDQSGFYCKLCEGSNVQAEL